MYGYIYETYDTLKNKYYIGKHHSEKYDENYFGSGKIICNIIRKRKETLTNKIICWCNSLEELNEKEKYYIQQYNSLSPNGYNISLGGDGGCHFQKHSDESKQKMREKQLGIPSPFKGKHFTDEQREKISQKVKEAFANGKGQNIDRKSYWTEENRKKKSEQMKGKEPWCKGKKMSNEFKEKTRNGVKKFYKEHYNEIYTDEYRKYLGSFHIGHKHSEETKEKIRQGNIGKKLSNETKNKISKSIKNLPKIKNQELFNKLILDKDIINYCKSGNYHSGWKELLKEKTGIIKNTNGYGLPKSEFIKYYKEHNII